MAVPALFRVSLCSQKPSRGWRSADRDTEQQRRAVGRSESWREPQAKPCVVGGCARSAVAWPFRHCTVCLCNRRNRRGAPSRPRAKAADKMDSTVRVPAFRNQHKLSQLGFSKKQTGPGGLRAPRLIPLPVGSCSTLGTSRKWIWFPIQIRSGSISKKRRTALISCHINNTSYHIV
jgi:hypothetical protein